jgi:hypothetical protein
VAVDIGCEIDPTLELAVVTVPWRPGDPVVEPNSFDPMLLASQAPGGLVVIRRSAAQLEQLVGLEAE